MKHLIDTAVFIWSIREEQQFLSPAAAQIIEDPKNELILSAVSVWEISLKQSLGKIGFKQNLGQMLDQFTRERNLSPLTVTYDHALAIINLPFHHKDPFDRLLIAQAQVEGLPILTPDDHFRKYDVEIIW